MTIKSWIATSRYALFAMTVSLLITPAFALGIEAPLGDPLKEARARQLFKEIRCVVCESEPIADSPAEVARDMRSLVRARIDAGESDETIKAFLVTRYGTQVLMTPPVTPATYALWFGPLLITLIAFYISFIYFRHPRESGDLEPRGKTPEIPAQGGDDKKKL